MLYSLDIEEMEGRGIAHVPALPGCFASDADQSAAVSQAPQAIADYFAWLHAHSEAVPDEAIQTEVREIQRAWLATPDNEINAFFAADRPPLTRDEIAQALRLLAAVEGLPPDRLDREVEDGWSILRILAHIVNQHGSFDTLTHPGASYD